MRRSLFDLYAADGARLVGTIDEPDGAPRSVVVIGPSGLQSRAGANRAYVTAARALAARGHRVLRADLGGIGEGERDLPEGHIATHWAAIESGLFVPDYELVLEYAYEHAGGAPVLAAGLCGGGVSGLFAAAELPWLAGVFAIGVPFIRVNQRVPPGFAPESLRRQALRTLARRRAGVGRHHLRRALRLFLRSLRPRRQHRSYDESANGWLNLPLVQAVLALHREGRPVELAYGEYDVACGQLEELVLEPHRLSTNAAFTSTRFERLGHQLDSPDEVERLVDAIDAWACRVAAASGRTAVAV